MVGKCGKKLYSQYNDGMRDVKFIPISNDSLIYLLNVISYSKLAM